MTDAEIEVGLDELEDAWSNEGWAERIVEAAAFRHLAHSPRCVGFTIFSSGRAACFAHECGWAISGRIDDAGERRGALFGLTALGTIGLAIEAATHNATTTIAIEAATEAEAIQLALAKFRERYPTAEIAESVIRWVPGEDDLS